MKLDDDKQAAILNGSFEVFQTSRDWWKISFSSVTGRLIRPATKDADLSANDWEPVVPAPVVTQKAKMLAGIKVGDRVWTNSGYGDRSRLDAVRTVKRLTATQIILEPGNDFDRYNRFTGYKTSGSYQVPFILAVATKAEAARYDAGKAAEQAKRDADKAADESFAAVRDNLRAMFPSLSGGSIFVTGNRHKQQFSIEMNDLTRRQVEHIAATLTVSGF